MQNGMVAGGKGLSAWGRKYCDEGVGEKRGIEKGKIASLRAKKKTYFCSDVDPDWLYAGPDPGQYITKLISARFLKEGKKFKIFI